MTFVEEVTTPEWLAQATAWIDSSLQRIGMPRTGLPEQPRVRPWSTQLIVPVADGRVWFKANCSDLRHEAALHAELAGLVPDEIDAPIAADAAHGWLLTRDRGPTMTGDADPTLEQWCAVVEVAADLQRRLVRHTETMLATGLPDCRPDTILARFDHQLDRLSALPHGHPAHLGTDLRARLLGHRPTIERAVEVLRAGPFPGTLNHGDLHPGNFFDTPDGLRLFDFGDAQWASAPETLVQVWAWLRHSGLPYERAFAVYAEAWSDLASPAELDEAFAAVMETLPVNRSLTWSLALADATVEEQGEWADGPLFYLEKLLEPWRD